MIVQKRELIILCVYVEGVGGGCLSEIPENISEG